MGLELPTADDGQPESAVGVWQSPTALWLERRIVQHTTLALGVAFALIAMPAPRRDWSEVVVAGIAALALIGIASVTHRLPRVTVVLVPLGYLAVAALLRDSAGGSLSGFGGLYLLPILWLSLCATAPELVIGLFGLVAAQLVPLLVIGSPHYPSSGWRSAFVQVSVAAIAGFTIQRLTRMTVASAAESGARARELEQATVQLSEQNRRLVELDQLKDNVVALVSHELRTPLTSIIGYLEMVRDDDRALSPAQTGYIEIAMRNADRLTIVVNDLLFLARLESSELTVTLRPVDVSLLLADALEAAKPTAEAKQIVVAVDVAGPCVCLGDRERLVQLIENLVSNAVKFTPPGGQVRISAAEVDGLLEVAVGDTGIGIEPAEIAHIFSRFYRTSSAMDDGIPGTGLGLAIAQSIAKAHGSVIGVESIPGTGTTFRFSLPSPSRGQQLESRA